MFDRPQPAIAASPAAVLQQKTLIGLQCPSEDAQLSLPLLVPGGALLTGQLVAHVRS